MVKNHSFGCKGIALVRSLTFGIIGAVLLFVLPGCEPDDEAIELKSKEELVQEVYRLKEEGRAQREEISQHKQEIEKLNDKLVQSGEKADNDKKNMTFIYVASLIVAILVSLLFGAGLGSKTRDAANRQRKESPEEEACKTTKQ